MFHSLSNPPKLYITVNSKRHGKSQDENVFVLKVVPVKKKTLPHHQTQQNKCHALVNQQGPEWKKGQNF